MVSENSSVVGEEATEVTKNLKSKKLSNKAKATIISVVAVILVILSWYLYQTSINSWEVRQEEMAVEYGENVSLELADLVDVETYTKVTSDNTTVSDNFEYVNVESESEDDEESDTTESYLEIGKYEVDVSHTIEYKLFSWIVYSYEDTKNIVVIVQDTMAPVLAEDNPTEFEIVKDCKIENLSETFKATDLSEIEFLIDEQNVDLTTVGEYTATLYATDTSGNSSNAEIIVKVIEPTISLDTESVDLKVGETTTVKATVKGKDDTVTWSSSDENIATISEDGVVTAVSTGNATITAKANDIEETVKVTVTKVTTSTSSSGSSSSSSSSNSGSSSKSSSSSSSSSSSNSSSSTTKKSETTTEQSTTQATCTNVNNHSTSCGNSGKWFNSKSAAASYYSEVCTSWRTKHENGEITYEEYAKNCPYGYECWNCSYCGYWTVNLKYR